MAKRKVAKEPTEDQMQSEQPLEPDNGDPDQQGDEQENGDSQEQLQPTSDQQEPARDFDAEEAALKLQMQELRKHKKEAKKGSAKPAKAVKVKAPRPPKDEANGVTRPGLGVTKEVWDTADALSKKLGTFVDRSTLTDTLNGKIETGTIHTQYGRWRKYYGLTETRDQRAARMEQIRAKKLADLNAADQSQAEAQGEQQTEATQ